jgi:hypothetical protein
LEALSGKKRKVALKAIEDAGTAYVQGPLRETLLEIISNWPQKTWSRR